MSETETEFARGAAAERRRIAECRPGAIEMIRRGLWLDMEIQRPCPQRREELRGRLAALTMELEGRSWE